MSRYNLTFDLSVPTEDLVAAVSAALDGDLAPARAAGAVIEEVPSPQSPQEKSDV